MSRGTLTKTHFFKNKKPMEKEQLIQQEEWKPVTNPWLIIMPVMIATFMYALDETVCKRSASAYCRNVFRKQSGINMGFNKLFNGKQYCNPYD